MERILESGKLQKTIMFYYFGEFRIDAAERRLWCGDELVSLTPKEFDVLLYLVERAGQVAEKNNLLDAIWTDVYVEETTLARNISYLRTKLTDCGSDKVIETVSKRGYRFTAEVTRSEKEDKLLFVEEQTIQHFRIEETITIDDALAERMRESENTNLLPSNIAASPLRSFPFSPLFVAALGFVALAGIGFIIYQNFFEVHTPKTVIASNVVPFSGSAGRENSPAFSPDGKQLTFSWDGGDKENSDIYVRFVGAGEPLRLTDTEINEQYPVFSPDGSNIAFVRGEAGKLGEVYIVPTLGGVERRICRTFSGNYSISYSPDGKNIAVVDTENSTDGGQYAIYLINIETGERQRLTVSGDFVGETTPRFSPDGKSVAFVQLTAAQNQDLFVVPANGGEPRQITFDATIIHSLAWSADGREIYFVSFRGSNQAKVWRVANAGGEPELISTGGTEISNIAVSSDNKKFAFVENTKQWKIWRISADGQPPHRLFASTANDFNPQYSPDGSRIVFISDRTGRQEVWAANMDGKNLRQMTDSPLEANSPQFSPDNSRIAFHRTDGDAIDIIKIPADGGAEQRITQNAGRNFFPTWSADGKWIYFISDRTGENQLWKVSVDGGNAVQITSNGAYQAAPVTDGKTVYFIKSKETSELYRIPADDGAEELMPEFTANGFAGKWTVSPSGIYFPGRNTDQSYNIKFYDFAAGKVKDALGSYKIPFNINMWLSANDENSFLYSAQDQNISHLMIAELTQAD